MKQHTGSNLQGDSPPVCFIITRISLRREWKINTSATKMSARPCSLFFPTLSTTALKPIWWNCGFFFVCVLADVLMWQPDNTCNLEGGFLAGCLSFGWRCCSQVRCSLFGIWQDMTRQLHLLNTKVIYLIF